MKKNLAQHRKPQSGFTLLEVLVAILICSFGLLGIIGLQIRASQFSLSAEDTGRAVLLANEIATEMYATNAINLPASTITAWKNRVGDPTAGLPPGLPNGVGSVDVAGNIATITITWRANSAASGAANSANKYVTQVAM